MFYKLFLILASTFTLASAVIQLKQHNINRDEVTCGGISSGGAMATQYHFANSGSVKGTAIFEGGPYLCGYFGIPYGIMCTTLPGLVNIQDLIDTADFLSVTNQIDNVANIHGSKVYIFHGTLDSTVPLGTGKLVDDMYKHYGSDILTEFTIDAEHGQPTDNIGGPCETQNPPEYLNMCNYNGAYEALNHLHGGNLIKPNRSDTDFKLSSELEEFDQKEFFGQDDPRLAGFDEIGYIYIPEKCKDGNTPCKLHVSFHGCGVTRSQTGDSYATKTGYLEVGDLNDIILIFPQLVPTIFNPVNPSGCWDWFAYTGQDFPLKHGKQNEKVFAMQERVVNGI